MTKCTSRKNNTNQYKSKLSHLFDVCVRCIDSHVVVVVVVMCAGNCVYKLMYHKSALAVVLIVQLLLLMFNHNALISSACFVYMHIYVSRDVSIETDRLFVNVKIFQFPPLCICFGCMYW